MFIQYKNSNVLLHQTKNLINFRYFIFYKKIRYIPSYYRGTSNFEINLVYILKKRKKKLNETRPKNSNKNASTLSS